MRTQGPGFKLGMKLGAQHKGMIFDFHDFHQIVFGRIAGNNQTGFFQLGAIFIVEFVAVAVPLIDLGCFVSAMRDRAFF